MSTNSDDSEQGTAVFTPRRTWRKKDLLRESLLGLARSLGPGQRLPTVAVLCESLSVSNSTLDIALRDVELRGAIVRQHGKGIFVSPTIRLKTVGVVFGGDIFSPGFSPFWSLLLQAVKEQTGDGRLVARAYLDITQSSGGVGGHAQLVEDLEDRRLDGVLLLSPQIDHDEAGWLRKHGVPLVLLGDRAEEGWSVAFDWTPLTDRAAAEIARSGCRRVGLLASPAHRAALEEACGQAGADGVQIDDWSYETWSAIIPGVGTRENCAHRLTERMIAGRATNPLPDALVSLEDTMTRGVVTALLQNGLQPGRDLRIVTAENKGSPVLQPYAADLVRVVIDPAKVARAALGMLETLMDGGTPPENPARVRAEEEQGLGARG